MRGRIVTIVVGVIFGLVAGAPDLVRTSGLLLARRTGRCHVPQSIYSYRNLRYQERAQMELAKRSRMVEAKAGLERWATPRGDYWVRPRLH